MEIYLLFLEKVTKLEVDYLDKNNVNLTTNYNKKCMSRDIEWREKKLKMVRPINATLFKGTLLER